MRLRYRKLSRPIVIIITCTLLAVIVWYVAILFIQTRKTRQFDALLFSIESGRNNDVERLLKAGADPSMNHGEALRRARLRGENHIVELLKRYGAKE